MKKKIFIVLILVLSFMLVNTNNVKADDNLSDEDINMGGTTDVTGGGTACHGFTTNGYIYGVKITFFGKEKTNKSLFFNVNNKSEDFNITNGEEGKKNAGSLYIDNNWNTESAGGEFFKSEIKTKGIFSIIISKFATEYGKSSYEFQRDNHDGYFQIEPIFLFEYCDFEVNDGKTTYGPLSQDVYKYYTPIEAYEKKDYFVGTISKNNYDIENLSPQAKCNLISGFHIVNSGFNPNQKFQEAGLNLRNIKTCQDKVVNVKLEDYLKDDTVYGKGLIQLTEEVCRYYDPTHFQNNKENGPGDSSGGVDRKTNCCKYFNDTILEGMGITKTQFYIDHPECIEPAEYVFNGAICNDKNKATLDTKDKGEVNIWAKIFANMYNENKNLPSNYLKFKINDDVTLICEEDITITYPAFVDKKIIKGGFFVWPKVGELRINSTVQCRPYVDVFSENSSNNSLDLNDISKIISKRIKEYNLEADFNLKYTDSEYGTGVTFNLGKIESIKDDPITIYDSTYSVDYNFSNNTIDTINELKNIVYKFNAQATYKLPTTYRFQNIETLKYAKNMTSIPSEMLHHYNDRKEGVLPISYNSSDGDKGSLTISFTKIGGNSNINIANVKTKEGKKADSKYTCEYTITDNKVNDPCTCPSGTKNSGIDITKLLCEANEELYDSQTPTETYYSCPLLQEKYCNDSNLVCKCDDEKYLGIVTSKDKCSSLQKSCNSSTNVNVTCSDGNNILISQACSDDESCKNYFCNINNPNTCKYTCPEDSPNAGKDITRYVFAYIADAKLFNQGKGGNYNFDKTLNIAYNVVTDKDDVGYADICWNTNQNKKNIVYRTISLDNPFPGKEGKGRIPGSNWYEYIYKYINKENKIISRGESGNDLYSNKTPLYTIELTPSDIRKIRDYNNKHSYDDFNLDCKSNGSGNCISNFLHREFSSIVTDGSCRNIKTEKDFDSCIE